MHVGSKSTLDVQGSRVFFHDTEFGVNWDGLAYCESTNNPHAVNNPAGYLSTYGLFQFDLPTWATVGGSGNPGDASPGGAADARQAAVPVSRPGAVAVWLRGQRSAGWLIALTLPSNRCSGWCQQRPRPKGPDHPVGALSAFRAGRRVGASSQRAAPQHVRMVGVTDRQPVSLLGAAEIRRLADELDLRPTKSLGQNFVHDGNTVRRIVASADLRSTDHVLEIGPGLGSLTLGLLDAVAAVTAVEIDPRLAGLLPRTVAAHAPHRSAALQVITADALDDHRRPARAGRPGARRAA